MPVHRDPGQVRGRPHRRDQRGPSDPRRRRLCSGCRGGLTPPRPSAGGHRARKATMTERSMRDRVILHDDIGAMEADFSGMQFATDVEGDAFYDEADRRLEATGKRWYFLVVYTECVIAPEVWDRFA